MKNQTLWIVAIWLGCFAASLGEPTEFREWSAVSGHKTKARAISSDGRTVKLELANGSLINLELAKIIPADRELILEHFEVEAVLPPGPGNPLRSTTPPADAAKLPYPQGEIGRAHV